MTDEKKKMTAQGSSVGADDGQSISQNYKTTIPAADHFGVGGEVEGTCPLHAKHTEHPALQTALVIFQSKIEHGSLVDFVAPIPRKEIWRNFTRKCAA